MILRNSEFNLGGLKRKSGPNETSRGTPCKQPVFTKEQPLGSLHLGHSITVGTLILGVEKVRNCQKVVKLPRKSF